MQLFIISPSVDIPDEPRVVGRILEQSTATFHLRKPGQGVRQLAGYLKQIPQAGHRRIMIHGHRRLLSDFDLKGVHFTQNQRLRRPACIRKLKADRPGCRISSSFHRIADITEPAGLFDYIFLSPIFDSISKPGYSAAFDHAALKGFLSHTGHTVVALGGIDVRRAATAAALGFRGIAVLGAVWGEPSPEEAVQRLSAVCRQ